MRGKVQYNTTAKTSFFRIPFYPVYSMLCSCEVKVCRNYIVLFNIALPELQGTSQCFRLSASSSLPVTSEQEPSCVICRHCRVGLASLSPAKQYKMEEFQLKKKKLAISSLE